MANSETSFADPGRDTLCAVFIEHRSALRAIALRILGRSELADDVMQDAYIKLSTRRGAHSIRNPIGYCCQVVRNTAIDYYRCHTAEASIIVSDADETSPAAEDSHRFEARIDGRRLLDQVEAVLATLPQRARHAFELHRLHGKTQREIGKMIGVSATLVNLMIKDAMHALAAIRAAYRDG